MLARMPLTSGTRLGPYEIQSPVGAGGMGEVYRARDTRLDRTVAIKILPAAVSSDPDRLLRFQHEARILSTLNHPNVLAIFDVGEQDVGGQGIGERGEVRYLVSEFLEGQSLREVLGAGALPRRKTTEYALEIAKGLAAAHEKGVVHRDLKPDNIFITSDDRVKILDFGLAKQTPAESAAEETPTMTVPAPTTPGTVMGTVGYMSPEQVRGQTVDHRSDIFSFGAVLYEMVSGKRAFSGESSVETMNAILKEDVGELSGSGGQVSPGLDRIIRRCLEKKPERRFQSASDLAFAIEALSATSGVSQAVAVTALPSPSRRMRIGWVIAAMVILVLGLGLAAASVRLYEGRSGAPPTYTQIAFRPSYIRMARFAPGGVVVYGASVNGEPMTLFSTRTDTLQSQPLNVKADLLGISRSGELAVSLNQSFNSWTPSGRLARVPLGGGATRELLDNVVDADWNKDGSELAISRRVTDGSRLEYPPGKVLYETSGWISDLRFSPMGGQIAFLDHPIIGDDRGWVSVIDAQGHDFQGERRVLTQEFSSEQGLAWSPSGEEIWFSAIAVESGTHSRPICAVNLQGKFRIVAGAPIYLQLQDIASDGRILLTTVTTSASMGTGETKSGRVHELSGVVHRWISGISADGSMLLVNGFETNKNNSYQLYVQSADDAPPVLLGEGGGAGFSPDSKWAIAVDVPHPDTLFIIPTSVGDSRTLHAPSGQQYSGAAFLPDGKRLLISTKATGRATETAVQDVDSGAVHIFGPPGRHLPANGFRLFPGPSPDGRLCIETDGTNQWLQPIDGGQAKEITGIDPTEWIIGWHGDSNNLFLAVPTGAETEVYNLNLATGARTLWFRFSPTEKAGIRSRDILFTPDGSRFAYVVLRINSDLFVADGLR
jgi:eukaryotic-like serine/threonine-protein kinase